MVVISSARKEGTLPRGAKVQERSRSVRENGRRPPRAGEVRFCAFVLALPEEVTRGKGMSGEKVHQTQDRPGMASLLTPQPRAAVSACPSWPVFT